MAWYDELMVSRRDDGSGGSREGCRQPGGGVLQGSKEMHRRGRKTSLNWGMITTACAESKREIFRLIDTGRCGFGQIQEASMEYVGRTELRRTKTIKRAPSWFAAYQRKTEFSNTSRQYRGEHPLIVSVTKSKRLATAKLG